MHESLAAFCFEPVLFAADVSNVSVSYQAFVHCLHAIGGKTSASFNSNSSTKFHQCGQENR